MNKYTIEEIKEAGKDFGIDNAGNTYTAEDESVVALMAKFEGTNADWAISTIVELANKLILSLVHTPEVAEPSEDVEKSKSEERREEIQHEVTDEDLKENPELKEAGVEVGETVGLGAEKTEESEK